MDQLSSRLNPHQREAVLHGDGPLLILAGAGSGKTSTMAHRIAHLISMRQVPANGILGLSFTNKAASELKQRVTGLVARVSGPQAAQGIVISTFHSLCARLLRAHAEKLGFKQSFTIVDRSDQRGILRGVYKNLNIDDRKFDHDLILGEIGQAKSRFLSGEGARGFFLDSGRLSGNYAIAAAEGFDKYQDQLKLLNAMDFDDLLYYGVRLLADHADVRERYNARFRYILVDEYQDTNEAQFRLLKLLTQKQQNLCVVGDDDQSIYSWRGANPSHILRFGESYPGARVITLDQNYRSTGRILDAANQVIAHNPVRHPKKLWSERDGGEPIAEVLLEEDREEGEWVGDEIQRRAREEGRPWRDFAVLYRSNAQSRIFEESLRRRRVPYRIVGGMSFLDRKEVRNVLAFWRVIANPSEDASLRRILNWPSRGIGKTSVEALSDLAFRERIPLFETFARAPELATPKSAAAIARFQAMILSLQAEISALPANPVSAVQWAKRSLELFEARRAVEEDTDEPAQFARKWENVEELLHSLGQMKAEPEASSAKDPQEPSGLALLQDFLSRMALRAHEEEESAEEKASETDNQVTLLTLHGAKGLEYPVVFLVGMEDGFLPHQRSIDQGQDLSEERRLCYVGITRAKDHLILTRAKHRIRYGKPVPRYRSRFLAEIGPDLILAQDLSLPDANSSKERIQQHEVRVRDFAASIREKLGQGKSGKK